jgi:hypothetical protein
MNGAPTWDKQHLFEWKARTVVDAHSWGFVREARVWLCGTFHASRTLELWRYKEGYLQDSGGKEQQHNRNQTKEQCDLLCFLYFACAVTCIAMMQRRVKTNWTTTQD